VRFDGDALARELAPYSARDAAVVGDYLATVDRVADVLRQLVLQTPPDVEGGLLAALRAGRLGWRLRGLDLATQRALLDFFTKSVADILSGWFESDEARSIFAFDGQVGFYGPTDMPGSGYVLLHHAFGEVNGKRGAWGHAIGGMGAITQAMAACATERSVTIERSAPVAELLVEAGRTAGVRLEDGRIFRAPIVASNLNPKLLYTKLIDAAHLPADFLRRMQGWRCGSGTLRMNVALRELPDFTAFPGTHQQDHHASGIVVAPGIAYMDQAYHDARTFGWARRPIVEMLIPSTLDDSLAPPGQHVASLFCRWPPSPPISVTRSSRARSSPRWTWNASSACSAATSSTGRSAWTSCSAHARCWATRITVARSPACICAAPAHTRAAASAVPQATTLPAKSSATASGADARLRAGLKARKARGSAPGPR
jgi:phytoene dehydrogenase-like protein